MFTTAFYAAGILVDATNKYQRTKSSNLQTNFFFHTKGLYIKFKCNSLYLKIQQPIRNKNDKEKN